jgi:hypothetical protein
MDENEIISDIEERVGPLLDEYGFCFSKYELFPQNKHVIYMKDSFEIKICVGLSFRDYPFCISVYLYDRRKFHPGWLPISELVMQNDSKAELLDFHYPISEHNENFNAVSIQRLLMQLNLILKRQLYLFIK